MARVQGEDRVTTGSSGLFIMNRFRGNLKIKPMYECRCDGRLQTKRFTRLSHAGLVVELVHLKIKTRLINEKLVRVIVLEVYYESIKREPKIRGINKCRCEERLQTKTKEFTRLPYTGLVLELEHLKIEMRLISERFANAMGECEN